MDKFVFISTNTNSEGIMFQFGPFGGAKKGQQAQHPADPVAHLQTIAKAVVDDPSVLNQNLREMCSHLATPIHDKVDQLLGQLIATHSSRMVSTLWTVLLQCLKDTTEPRAQLPILHHFSNIVDRISIPQRSNAFRAFAKEVSPLCEKAEILGDRSFSKSFGAIIVALGAHAEQDLCTPLMERCLQGVFGCTRLDSRRAGAQMVARLIASTKHCGTFASILDLLNEEGRDPLGCALLVDAGTSLAIDQARLLAPASPQTLRTIARYESRVEEWLLRLLRTVHSQLTSSLVVPSTPQVAVNSGEATMIPLLVSSFVKLRHFHASWQSEHHELLANLAGDLLTVATLRKVLLCPLLSLLRSLPHALRSAGSTEACLALMEEKCKDQDSMVRCEAYSALEVVLPCVPLTTVARLVREGVNTHRTWMVERCNMTVRGMLSFFTSAYPLLRLSDADSDVELCRHVLHVLVRAHLDLSNTVNNVPTVQFQLLCLIEHTVTFLSGESVSYVLFCLQRGDATVREKAIEVLRCLCSSSTIDRIQLFESVPRGLDFFEESCMADCSSSTSVRLTRVVENHSWQWERFLRNATVLVGYFSHKLAVSMECSEKSQSASIQTSCEVLRSLADAVGMVERSLVASGSVHAHLPSLSNSFTTVLRLLVDELTSVVPLPLDAVIAVMQCAARCSLRCSPTDSFDIFFHKSAFQFVWNILHRCCGAIDPIAVPKLHMEPSLYLSHMTLSTRLDQLIHQASQSALQSSDNARETSFHKFVTAALELLLALCRWGRRSPVFVAHVRHQYRFLLVCFDILAASHPVLALRGCKEFFVTMFVDGGECSAAPSDREPWKPIAVNLSDTVPALQRTKYVSASVSILNRSLASDLVKVGADVFDIIQLFIAVDNAVNDVSCYRAIDEKLSLVKRMTDIASQKGYYNGVHGSKVAVPVIKTLMQLHFSPHRAAVDEVLSYSELHASIRHVVQEASEDLGEANLFSECLALLFPAETQSQLMDEGGTATELSLHWPPAVGDASAFIVALEQASEPDARNAFEEFTSWLKGTDVKDVAVSEAAFQAACLFATKELTISSDVLCAYNVSSGKTIAAWAIEALVSCVDDACRIPQLTSFLLDMAPDADLIPVLNLLKRMLQETGPQALSTLDGCEFPGNLKIYSAAGAMLEDVIEIAALCDEILNLATWTWKSPDPSAPLWRNLFRNSVTSFDETAPIISLQRRLLIASLLMQGDALFSSELLCCSEFWTWCVAVYPELPLLATPSFFESNDDSRMPSMTMDTDEDNFIATAHSNDHVERVISAMEPLLDSSFSAVRVLAMALADIFTSCSAPQSLYREFANNLKVQLKGSRRQHAASFATWVWDRLVSDDDDAEEGGDDGTPNDDEEQLPISGDVATSPIARLCEVLRQLPFRGTLLEDVSTLWTQLRGKAPHSVECVPLSLLSDAFRVVRTETQCNELFTLFVQTISTTATLKINSSVLIGLVNAFIRCEVTSVTISPEGADTMLLVIAHLLADSFPEEETTLLLRYSAMYLLVLFAPDKEWFWQNILDGSQQTSEWSRCQHSVLKVLQLCLELGDTVELPAVATYAVSIFLCSSGLSVGIHESILWMVVKCCPLAVWNVVLHEELCQKTDLSALRFLCKMSQTVGMCQYLVQEIHARYTPLLLSFGSSRSELDCDEQRMAFWLTTSLLLHTVISEERHTKPKPHFALGDSLPLYVDYPLASMSHETASRIRRRVDEHMFPFFSRLTIAPNERNWNIHTRGHLLPLCGRQSLSKATAEKMFTSILHMYAHVVVSVFDHTSQYSPEALTDVFFSLSTLSAGNASLLKHSPALEGTIASSILTKVYGWYRKHIANVISDVDSKHNVLNFRMGLFPESSSCLEFTDTFSLASCTNIISSLFVRGNELIPGAVDVNFILEKMLCMDIVTHQGALTAVIVMSGTSTRKEMSRIAPLFTQRLFRDLDVCSKGSLSVSFGVLQLLRSAFSIVAAIPDDGTTMKICEAVWNSIIAKGVGGRRVQHYAHFLLQSIISMSTVSHAQWCVLRALVGSVAQASPSHQVILKEPPMAKAKSFAEGFKGRLDRLIDGEEQPKHIDAHDSYIMSVRQSSISCGNQFAASPTPQSSVGYSAPPSDQHSFAAPSEVGCGNAAPLIPLSSSFMYTTCRLLKLVTTSAVILRSKTEEDEIDHNRVQVMDLLHQAEDTVSAAGGVVMFALQQLLAEVLEPNDSMFVILNRFNYSEASLILFNEQVQLSMKRARESVQEGNARMATMTAFPQLTLFFETALRRQEGDRNCWWTVANVLGGVLTLWDGPVWSCIVRALALRLPVRDIDRVAHFVVDIVTTGGVRKKDVKMLLKSIEGAAKGGEGRKSTDRVVAKIQSWLLVSEEK